MKSIRTMSSLLKPSLLSQSCTLSDGRVLSYAEFGDPTGYPLIFFHGFPSCRLEAWFLDPIVQRKGIRLIAPDRPGFGRSTFQPNRHFFHYPSDIQALADHLEVDKFAILGGSGGGPYALACAKDTPGRLSAVGLFASAGPWEIEGDEGMRKELTKDIRPSTKRFASAVKHAPRTMNVVTKVVSGTISWLFSRKWVVAYVDKQIRQDDIKNLKKAEMGEKVEGKVVDQQMVFDRQTLADRQKMDENGGPGPGEQLAQAFKETFHQGTSATMQEAALLCSPWGFDISTITYDKIQVWHGTKDINAPLNQIRYFVDRIPHCELKTYDADHFELVKHIEEVLDDLITDKVRQQE
jgi:pimeloyl-ACP methyl ester carboxylesterase